MENENTETKLLSALFERQNHLLKRTNSFQKTVLKERCRPYFYKIKPEATENDMKYNNNGSSFFPVKYEGETYLAVYAEGEVPVWLSGAEEGDDDGRVLITDEVLDNIRIYDYGSPSFFNPRCWFARNYHINIFSRVGLKNQKCEIEIDGKTITGTVTEIGFSHMELTLDLMPEFKKHIEIDSTKVAENSFIRRNAFSDFAKERCRAELKKLYFDYRFFFIDYPEEIKEFFRNYFAGFKDEIDELKETRLLSKKCILKDFNEGKISENEKNALLEKRKAAGERSSFIYNDHLVYTLREYSRKHWGREVQYQKYYQVINEYLVKGEWWQR